MVSARSRFESFGLVVEPMEDRTLLASDSLAAIGGVVFSDHTDQGFTQQAPRLAGVQLLLFRDGGNGGFEAASSGSDDTLVAETTTDELGRYRFGDLGPGEYFLFQRSIAGFMRKPEQTVLTLDVSEDDAANGTTLSADVANFEPLSLGGDVWNDLNNDGLFDHARERGIANVLVNLVRDNDHDGAFTAGVDSLLQSVFSNAAGRYVFVNLFPGDYLVQIDEANFSPIGALHDLFSSTPSRPSRDPDDNVDDDGEPLSGHGVLSGGVTLEVGDEPTRDTDANSNTNLTVDFGFLAQADLEITVESSPTFVTPGDEVTFTVTVTNHGPSRATPALASGDVTPNVPGGTPAAADSCITTHRDGSIIIRFESLAAGESLTCSFTTVISGQSQPGTLVATLLVNGNEYDKNLGNNGKTIAIQIVSPGPVPTLPENGSPPAQPGTNQPAAPPAVPAAGIAIGSSPRNVNPLSKTIGSGGKILPSVPPPVVVADEIDLDVDYSGGADELDGVLAYLADAEPPRLLAIDVGDEVVRSPNSQTKSGDSDVQPPQEVADEQESPSEEATGTDAELGHTRWIYVVGLAVPLLLATGWSYRHVLLGALRRSPTGHST